MLETSYIDAPYQIRRGATKLLTTELDGRRRSITIIITCDDSGGQSVSRKSTLREANNQ